MKSFTNKLFYLFLLFSISLYAQDFYDINTINTIELQFAEDNWDQILDQLVSKGNEERHLATAIINGVQFDSVGVRYKGNSSYNANQKKNPFNIKLDYIIDDQEYDNYGTIKLSNLYKDPSFVRETLSYEIANTYFPASKANYTNLYVNDSHLGLYVSVQDVDKYFLNKHYDSKNNAFFKGELVGNGGPQLTTIWEYLGSDSASYKSYYEIESENGWYELISFLDVLNNNTDNVDQVLNVDRHLWMLAYDILMVNLDSPVNFAHNYYLYEDNNGRFNPIVWDLNENFGVFSRLLTGINLSTTDMQQMDPFLNSTDSRYPIISKILSNSEYKKMYVAHMKTIISDYFSNGKYATRARELQSIIDSDVQTDPNKLYTYSQFLSNVENSASISGGGPGNQSIIGITQLMEARISYILSQNSFSVSSPEITNVLAETFQLSEAPQNVVVVNASIKNADNVQLAYRFNSDDTFTKVEMLDDGNNLDDLSDDDIYGVYLHIFGNKLEYYIYAENNDAVAFSPERAEYEFYTYDVNYSTEPGTIVINEFMADNESYISDQDEEFDDWIELYNNSDAEVSLLGYYLSDDYNDLAQWAFPDTTIQANGYLTIWADNDIDQSGLHASFKLSSGGESLFIVDADTNIVEQVIYSEQKPDTSYGRFHNGIGEFTFMIPTYDSENRNEITTIQNNYTTPNKFRLEQNYPNPFNPTTNIEYSISNASLVKLEVYDILGQSKQTLVNEFQSAGNYQIEFNASNLSSGIYIYRLYSEGKALTKKMILLK